MVQLEPDCVVPVSYTHLDVYKRQIHLTDDGQVWEVSKNLIRKGKPILSKPVMIDAMGISDLGEVVLRDREVLAEYGMICM